MSKVFLYEAYNPSTESVQKGSVHALSAYEAETKLKTQGLKPLKVTRKNTLRFSLHLRRSTVITNSVILQFTEEIATLLKAGFEISEVFRILSQTKFKKSAVNTLVKNIRKSLQNGDPLHEAFNKQDCFPSFYIRNLYSFKNAGNLAVIFKEMADYLAHREKLMEDTKRALSYPTFLLSASVIAFVFLLTNVLPDILYLGDNENAQKHFSTRLLIGMSQGAQNYGALLLLVLILGVVGFIVGYTRSDNFRKKIDKWLLKLPLIGTNILLFNQVQLLKTFGMLLAQGISMAEIIPFLRRVSRNAFLQQDINHTFKKIHSGETVGGAFRHSKLLSSEQKHMINVASRSSNLSRTCLSMAEIAQQKLQKEIKLSTKVLEIATLALMAAFIALIIMGTITPLLSLSESLAA